MSHRSTGRAARLSWPTRWPEKIGKGLTFISLNVEPRRARPQSPRWTCCAQNSRPGGVPVKEGSWGYRLLVVAISTAISSSSTIGPRLHRSKIDNHDDLYRLERLTHITVGFDDLSEEERRFLLSTNLII